MTKYPRIAIALFLLVIWFALVVASLELRWFKYLSDNYEKSMVTLLLLILFGLFVVVTCTVLLFINWLSPFKGFAAELRNQSEKREILEMPAELVINEIIERVDNLESVIENRENNLSPDLQKTRPGHLRVVK